MKLQLRHVLAICLTVLLMVGRGHVEHATHSFPSTLSQQFHHCDKSRSAPDPANSDCEDRCPLCQVSLKDDALLAPAIGILSDPRWQAMRLAARVETTGPLSAISAKAHWARAPPLTTLYA